jgi:hypothetical protein
VARTASLVLLTVLLTSCGLAETEGRSDEARATLDRYLGAVGGAEDDRGWSVLSSSMRDSYGTRDDYLELAGAADDPLPIAGVRLLYEDDGFYSFSVTTAEPIEPAYAELLFRPRLLDSAVGCQTNPGEFEIAIIIAPFSEFDGVTGVSCKKGT